MEDLRIKMTQEICEMAKEKVTHLTGIWSDVGMVEAELEMKERLLNNIAQFTAKLQKLSAELAVSSPEVPDSLTVIERENTIWKRLEHLNEIKNSCTRQWRRLRAKAEKDLRAAVLEQEKVCLSFEELGH